MRIVLDLQGAQSESSRFRGIGRYSIAFAKAISQEARQHEVLLALSGRFPETIDPLRATFADLIPPECIRVVELPGPVMEVDLTNAWRMKAAELVREKFLTDLRPDIVHVSSMCEGAGNEAVVSAGRFNLTVPTSVLLHDLIPLLHFETHLSHPAVRRSYLRHVQSLKQAHLLLSNSEFSRQEAIETLGISPERITTIGAGLAQPLEGAIEPSPEAREELIVRHRLHRPFVLYTGAVDPHKNVEGLIAAFALLPANLRAAHQLALAGKIYEDDRKRLTAVADTHGLGKDTVFLGYVPDDDLRLLYGMCSVFVCPSLHEGFGLPILEAMACGAPVLGSNCTSIPEIINRGDALFEPLQPQDIASHIAEVLSNGELRRSLKTWGRERAKGFTWEACARKALQAFETIHAERKAASTIIAGAGVRHQPLLGFVSPLPPDQTTIADYSAKLLPNLARHYEIVCIVDQPEVTDPWTSAEFAIRDLRWFEANANRFERIIYQFGNSPSHKHMFSLLERHPGVVVLHDFHLGGLLNWMADSGYTPGSFTTALYESHGFSALQKDRENGREASIKVYPCNAAVLHNSVGVIVHSEEAIKQTQKWYGDSTSASIRYLPLPVYPPAATESNPTSERQESSYLVQANHPERVAALYQNILEELYTSSSQAPEQKLVQAIARTLAPTDPTEADLAAVATALAANRERLGARQILVDVTLLAQSDARTGIQRVTRAILMALIRDPPPGNRIEPVRAVKDGGYVYAREFTRYCLGLPDERTLADDPVETVFGDLFLGLDLCYDLIPEMAPWLEAQKRRGARIVFVVYDLLSLSRPHQFYPQIPPAVRQWLNTLANISDGLVCISRTVADEVRQRLDTTEVKRQQPLSLGFFHLGADLRASLPSTGLSEDASRVLETLRSQPTFLMVGTLEPRKGHCQALEAMELLWAEGVEANLLIVGKEGWMVDQLVERLQGHPKRDRCLFWLQGISDEMLEQVYHTSRALLVASEGEGFGLPLIEAAQYGLPIITRDLPIFREVAGEHAYYFQGGDPQSLANALRFWLSLGDAVPTSKDMPWLTWHQSSRQLLNVILNDQWHATWSHRSEVGT